MPKAMSKTSPRSALILILIWPLMAAGFYTLTQARVATQTGNRNTASSNSNTNSNGKANTGGDANVNRYPGANPNPNMVTNANTVTTPTANANAVTTPPAKVNNANAGGKDNGITVGLPKQFDERTLTLMLQSLENRLAQTQFPDPTGLFANVGRFGGATASTSSLAVSVRGPSTPTVATTLGSTSNNNTTSSLTNEVTQNTNNSTSVGPIGTTTNVGTTTNTGESLIDKTTNSSGTTGSTSNTMQQQITQPGLAPPTAVAPAQTSLYTYQPTFGISSQDLLTEQTALFYQITNLRLLLDRSLTDRITAARTEDGITKTSGRDQIVVGFQITIDAAHKDAVAEAEVSLTGPDVSLVALLPMDKTYNVASVTKSSKSVDVGAVVQLIGVGVAAGKTQESIYLIKDADTVSLERPVSAGELGKTVKFSWQFRPVLGRRTVEPGRRQVFALLSVPVGVDARALKVSATTKWRRYDRKVQLVGGLVSGTEPGEQYSNKDFDVRDPYITDFSLKPFVSRISWNDTGNGQVLAVAEGGGFTPDTSLILGNTVLNRQNGLTVANEQRLVVLAPGQLLAQWLPTLMSRYGTAEFERSRCVYYPDATPPTTPDSKCGKKEWDMSEPYGDLTLAKPEIKARDAVNSEVTVTLKAVDQTKGVNIPYRFKYHRPVVVIGGRVFGLSDAPFISTTYAPEDAEMKRSVSFTFVVPTQLLANSKSVTVKEFLWNLGVLSTDFTLSDRFTATGVTTLGLNGDKVQLAVSGGGFSKDVKVLVGDVPYMVNCKDAQDKDVPDCFKGVWVNAEDGTGTLLTLSPTKAQMKDVKYIVVLQGKAQPQALALTQPPPPVPTAKIITPAQPYEIGKNDSRQIRFEGANFESIKKVLFLGKEVEAKPDPDDKTVYLITLEPPLTSDTGTRQLVFVMKDEKEVRFDVKVIVKP